MAYRNPFAWLSSWVRVEEKKKFKAQQESMFSPSLSNIMSTDPLKSIPKSMTGGKSVTAQYNYSPIKKEVVVKWQKVPLVEKSWLDAEKAWDLIVWALEKWGVIRASVFDEYINSLDDADVDEFAGLVETAIAENPNLKIEGYNYATPAPKRTLRDKTEDFIKGVPSGLLWVAKWASDVWGILGKWIAYLDPTITTQEYDIANQSIDDRSPQPLKDVMSTKPFGIWREVGKIWATAALTYPIWWALWLAAKTAWAGSIGVLWTAAAEWALQQKLYNKASWDDSNDWVWVSAAISAAFPWAGMLAKWLWKTLWKAWSKIFTSWLMNPRNLEYTQNALRKWWDWSVDVVWWAIDKGIKWSEDTMISKLGDVIGDNRMLVKESVRWFDWLVKNNSVIWALEEMKLALEWSKSSKQLSKLEAVNDLIAKHNSSWLSWDEVQKVKEWIDDVSSIYTIAWDVRAWQKAQDLSSLRQDIRKIIEDRGTQAWIDLWTLNRDIAVAQAMKNWIKKKFNAVDVRELVSVFAPSFLWWAAAYDSNKSFIENIWNIAKWAVVGGVLWSKYVKTNVWTSLVNAWRKLWWLPTVTQTILNKIWSKVSELWWANPTRPAKEIVDEAINSIDWWAGAIDEFWKRYEKKALPSNVLKNVDNISNSSSSTLWAGTKGSVKQKWWVLATKKVKSDTVKAKTSEVKAPKQSDTLVSKADEMEADRLANAQYIKEDTISNIQSIAKKNPEIIRKLLQKDWLPENRIKSFIDDASNGKISERQAKNVSDALVSKSDDIKPKNILSPKSNIMENLDVLKDYKPKWYDYKIQDIDVKLTNSHKTDNYYKDLPNYWESKSVKYREQKIDNWSSVPPIVVSKTDDWFYIIDWYHRAYAQNNKWIRNIKALVIDWLWKPPYKNNDIFTKFSSSELDNLKMKTNNILAPKSKDLQPLYEEAKKYKSADEFVKSQGKWLYHGTKYNFEEFDIKKSYSDRNKNLGAWDAIYLSENKDVANKYANANANEYLHKSVIDEVTDVNAKKLLKGLVEDGFDKWRQSMSKDEINMMNSKWIDWNDINDLSEWIRWSRSLKDEWTNMLTINNKIEIPDNILKIAKKLWIKTMPWDPRTISVFLKNDVKIKNVWKVSNIKEAANQAKKEWFSWIKFKTSESVNNEPEIAIFDPSQIKTEAQLRKIREEANKK